MTDTALHPTDRKTRILTELKKFAVMTLYLWCIFQLFAIYRAMILREHGVDTWEQSFAIINALVLAKVVMTGQLFNLGRRLRELPMMYTAVGHAFGFAIVLLAFSIAEHMIKAAVKGLPVSAGLEDLGGGTIKAFTTLLIIFFVALLPFFAIQEAARVLGESNVRDLFFTRDKESYELVRR